MNTILTGAIGLVVAFLLATVGIKAEQHGANKVRRQWDAERVEWEQKSAALKQQKQDTYDGASQFKEDSRNDSRIIYRTITKNVPTYVDRPVYSQPCLDADGLRGVNAALTGRLDAEDSAEPDATVPAADAAGGRDRR